METINDLYIQYGNKYPYACDAIAYYIFGSKFADNTLRKAFRGDYGRHTEVECSQVSEYMLSVEYSWEDEMESIEEFIKYLPTANGDFLSTYY
jgi:hypothetical protein